MAREYLFNTAKNQRQLSKILGDDILSDTEITIQSDIEKKHTCYEKVVEINKHIERSRPAIGNIDRHHHKHEVDPMFYQSPAASLTIEDINKIKAEVVITGGKTTTISLEDETALISRNEIIISADNQDNFPGLKTIDTPTFNGLTLNSSLKILGIDLVDNEAIVLFDENNNKKFILYKDGTIVGDGTNLTGFILDTIYKGGPQGTLVPATPGTDYAKQMSDLVDTNIVDAQPGDVIMYSDSRKWENINKAIITDGGNF